MSCGGDVAGLRGLPTSLFRADEVTTMGIDMMMKVGR